MYQKTFSHYIIFIIVFLAFISTAFCQISKGTHFFGISQPTPNFLNIATETHPSGSFFQFNQSEHPDFPRRRRAFFSSTYGYFVSDNILLKTDLVFTISPKSFSFQPKGLYIKPVFRYYHSIGDSTMHIFGELGISNSYDNSIDTQFSGEASIGFSKMLTESVGFDFTLNLRQSLFNEDEVVSRELLFSAGLAAYLGKKTHRFKKITPALKKGTINIGATRFGLVRYNNFPGTRFYLNPQVNYFVSNKLGFGLTLGFNYENYVAFTIETPTTYYESYWTSQSILISPRIRYKLLNKSFLILFLETGGKLEYRQLTGETISLQSYTENNRNNAIFIGPVLNLFLTNQLALELGAFASRDLTQKELFFNSQIGIQIFLPR